MTENTENSPSLVLISAERDAAIAVIVAAARADGSLERAREIITNARAANATIRGVILNDQLVAVYIMEKVGASNEIRALAAAPDYRGQGYEKQCLADSFVETGKRPLVVEASEGGRAFYEQSGFKLVGRRPQPDGQFRYRLGRHAPRRSAAK